MKNIFKNTSSTIINKINYCTFLIFNYVLIFKTNIYAKDTVWTKASTIMKDVYTQILGISTISGIVCVAVALLMMNFSKSGKAVDESRMWLKRIIITWIILNSLGFIMAYITPLFSGGQYTP